MRAIPLHQYLLDIDSSSLVILYKSRALHNTIFIMRYTQLITPYTSPYITRQSELLPDDDGDGTW